MLRRPHCTIAAALAVVLLAGCVSPATRIKDQPDVFAAATPEQQALIRSGNIALGFKPEFVKLALGEPDRITERTDAKGAELTWHYTETSKAYIASSGYYDPFYGPYYGPAYPSPFVATPLLVPPAVLAAPSVETDRLRVVFSDGVVSAIERVVK